MDDFFNDPRRRAWPLFSIFRILRSFWAQNQPDRSEFKMFFLFVSTEIWYSEARINRKYPCSPSDLPENSPKRKRRLYSIRIKIQKLLALNFGVTRGHGSWHWSSTFMEIFCNKLIFMISYNFKWLKTLWGHSGSFEVIRGQVKILLKITFFFQF